MSIMNDIVAGVELVIPEVIDYFSRHKRKHKGIDCQEAKNHCDLEIASQNQGAIQDGAHELEPSSIMEKYQKTGQLPQMIAGDPHYGDFSEPLDFVRAHAIVERANEQFAALDSHIRNRFENDPVQFLAFVQDPRNLPELRKMGLANPEKVATPEPLKDQGPPAAPPPSQPVPKA